MEKDTGYLLALYPGDRVYVAARFERQAEARAFAAELMRAGYEVTSRWLYAAGLALGDPDEAAAAAMKDVADLKAADAYILLADEELGRGGKDFEAGVMWAMGRRVTVIGPPAHVFHFLPGVRRYATTADFRCVYLGAEKIDALP